MTAAVIIGPDLLTAIILGVHERPIRQGFEDGSEHLLVCGLAREPDNL